MKKCHVLWVILVAAFLVVTISVPAWGAKTIKIGVIGPMQFMLGKGMWNGALMAADEINAKGGVQVGSEKMLIELVQADSNELNNIADATTAMERLLTRDKVNFVLGGFRSEAVFPMQDIAMENKTIFIGCGCSNVELCKRVAENYDFYKYWFRETPFSNTCLARTTFINLSFVADRMKKDLNIPTIKVAVVAEKAVWADPMVAFAEAYIKGKGMELAGVWRPSPMATDVAAELAAIQRSGAHVIFTILASPVGIPFARQAGELKIPAVQVGINTEAQKDSYWQATQGKGDYVMTLNTFCQGVEFNKLTKPFVDAYMKRFGETPTYTTGTYSAIVYTLVPAIEKTGTLNADKIVAFLENYEHKTPAGLIKYSKDANGNPLHDITWGPGYSTGMTTQWQEGKMVGVWPYKWKPTPDAPKVSYKGMVPFKIPPWVIKAHKK